MDACSLFFGGCCIFFLTEAHPILPMNRRTVSIIKVPTKTLPPHSLFRYSSGTVPDEEALQNVLQAAIAEAEADGWQFV
ncbi:MAG: hypothetical protein ACI9R3_003711, partial [Verrucomicrobiales bacterium]